MKCQTTTTKNTNIMTTIEITPLAQVQMNQRIDLLLGDTSKLENFNDYKFTIPMKALVTDMVVLTDRDFNIFKMSLLDNQEWLSGKGGTDSDYQTETEDWLQMNEEEREAWKKQSFSLVVKVMSTTGEEIFIDPQGYDYARYVAIAK